MSRLTVKDQNDVKFAYETSPFFAATMDFITDNKKLDQGKITFEFMSDFLKLLKKHKFVSF